MLISLDDTVSLKTKIDRRASTLFEGIEGRAPLQVTRITGKAGLKLVKNEDVWNERQLSGLRNNMEDGLQIFTVRQDRTWSTLDIPRNFVESFMSTYEVFAPFWKFLFTFGIKHQENEFEFPGLRRRRNCIVYGGKVNYTHEFSYMMRRVEDNGRGENEDDSWSIRQTAVYHKFVPSTGTSGQNDNREKSTFLMVAPSQNAELRYNHYLEHNITNGGDTSVWDVHRILVADAVRGWGDYMASLETRLIACSDQIVMADVGPTTENLSPLKDFNINFEDRQDLKILEDSVVDLLIILPTFLKTIKEIKKQCEMCCDKINMNEERFAETETIMEEFDEYIKEVETYSERATVLNVRAKSTTQLLSDLLSYAEAVAMKELTLKAQDENTSMRWLAERSTKDAAAVKVLTVITLIYLPFSIVANFFSTEFVQTTDKGRMILARNFWLLFAIAIPLTAFTILLWWAWVHFTRLPNSTPQPAEFKRQHSLKSFVLGNKKKIEDLEDGLDSTKGSPQPSFPKSGAGTWSSVATTVRAE